MREVSKKLLIFQLVITVLVESVILLTTYRIYWKSLLAGAIMSCVMTFLAWIIFRCMPQVIRAKTFYYIICLYEVMKWLMVYLLSVVFIFYLKLSPLWLLIGFSVVYVFSYGLFFLLVRHNGSRTQR